MSITVSELRQTNMAFGTQQRGKKNQQIPERQIFLLKEKLLRLTQKACHTQQGRTRVFRGL